MSKLPSCTPAITRVVRSLSASAAPVVLELHAAAAAQVDVGRRLITGCLIPAPVDGVQAVATTSAGPTRFVGRLTWHADLSRIKLLTEHSRQDSVGYAIACAYRPDGSLWATWHVPPAPAGYVGTWPGDVALYEAEHHTRDGLSVGAFDLTASYATDGVLEVQAGTLREGSLCSIPAFDDSRVSDVAASSPGRHNMFTAAQLAALTAAGIDPANQDAARAHLASLAATAPVQTPAPSELSATELMDQMRDLLASARPVVPQLGGPNAAPNGAQAPQGDAPRDLSLAAFTSMLVDHYQGNGSPSELRAALSDVTVTNQQDGATGVSTAAFRPSYLGELWEATDYQRKFIDNATTVRPLPKAMKLLGQKWVTKPSVDDYDGDKAAVPSNVPELVDAEVAVERVAGAHDVDRALIDLGSPEWLAMYFEGQTESYRMKSNAKAIAKAWAEATALVDTDASPATFTTLLEGVIAGVVDLANVGQGVEYVAMAPGLIAELLGITNLDAPAWFNGSFQLGNQGDGGVGGTTWFTDPGIPAGGFILGQKSAIRYHEVDPPIRVQAVNVAQGGIDLGVFGYLAAYVRDANKVRKGTVGA
jgi:hypothetical protein